MCFFHQVALFAALVSVALSQNVLAPSYGPAPLPSYAPVAVEAYPDVRFRSPYMVSELHFLSLLTILISDLITNQ